MPAASHEVQGTRSIRPPSADQQLRASLHGLSPPWSPVGNTCEAGRLLFSVVQVCEHLER